MRFHPVAVVLVGMVVADLSAQSVPEWAVDPTPLAVVGPGASLDDELSKVTGAAFLSDGRIAVVNGKPLAIRIYRADGRFDRTVARSGAGPGEIRGHVELFTLPGDSLLAYSTNNNRWTVHTTDGVLGRESRVDGGILSFWNFHRRTFIRTDDDRKAGCAPAILERIPDLPPGARVREAYLEGNRLWVRNPAAADWTVYDTGGRSVGRVNLPAGFTLYQVADGKVLGKRVDADGFEEIVVFRVNAPPRSNLPCATVPFPTLPRESRAEVIVTMRNVMVAAEGYYARHGRYTTARSELGAIPDHVDIAIPYATDAGWGLVAFDRRTGVACVMAVGDGGLPGLQDGVIVCGT